MGLLAERYFGFSGDATRSKEPGHDLEKARALGNALLCFLVIPWTLCLVFYTGVSPLSLSVTYLLPSTLVLYGFRSGKVFDPEKNPLDCSDRHQSCHAPATPSPLECRV